ncbi:Hypothetical predicted protein [Cloeon dipterum]|uniref:AMP-dependent synthetase/ligase domain-containing protein n=1 Tax=Cloeon dipterum TaxID=197152 RepID=A0A8S1D637_9INSE|nr:Hypothetical predicted protein [Cloeon dipterum]
MMEATDQLLDKTILSLLRFEENGRRRAIIWRENAEEDKIYSYEQLSSESSKFAEKLCECDIPKNSFVAFTVGSLSYHCLPAVIIGILKHGCAFAPIADINNIVLKFCGNYVATHSASQVGFGNYIGECTVFGQTWHILKKCAVAPDVELDSQDYAYTLTTSGTTGIAKVVQVPHKAIVPNIIYLKERFGITSEDVILQCAPPTFDPFVVEMFMTFSAGATLLMIPPLEKSQPSLAFKAIIKSPTPTVIQATPSFICNFDTRSLLELLGPKSSLNVLAFGGEPCPMKSQLLQWKSADNRTRIFNLYGVTEVSCWSTCEELDFSNCEEIRLGDFLPFNQVQIRSINDDSELKSGVGQIFITTMDRMCTINGRSLRNQWHATGDLAKARNILKLALFVVPADNLKAVNKEVQHE